MSKLMFCFRSYQHVIFDASSMERDNDFFWRKDGIRWAKPSNSLIPRSNPSWKVMYYKATDSSGNCIKKTEYIYFTDKRMLHKYELTTIV